MRLSSVRSLHSTPRATPRNETDRDVRVALKNHKKRAQWLYHQHAMTLSGATATPFPPPGQAQAFRRDGYSCEALSSVDSQHLAERI
jgi:hypothetical protein